MTKTLQELTDEGYQRLVKINYNAYGLIDGSLITIYSERVERDGVFEKSYFGQAKYVKHLLKEEEDEKGGIKEHGKQGCRFNNG